MVPFSFHRFLVLIFVVGLLLPACDLFGNVSSGEGEATDTTDIASLVQERLDEQPAGTGLVVGIVEADDRRTLTRGVVRAEGDSVDERTLFEIGSITKTFTALALADRVEQGAVRLDAHATAFLPDSVDVPVREEKSISLEHLAAHTAGLARLPPNLDEQSEFEDPTDPYAAYSVAGLHRGLGQATLAHLPGTAYLYSNFGAGLLGHLLARQADTTYGALIRERIMAPLGMDETRAVLSEGLAGRFATGHRPDGTAAAHWHFRESMAGAGVLRSSVRDMMTYLAAQLGQANAPVPVRRAIERSHTTLYDREGAGPIAYGWHVREQDGHTVFWHNGGTGGFHSFAGFNREHDVGVIVLSNVAQSVDETGWSILDAVIASVEEERQG